MPTSRYLVGTLPWYSVLIVAGICTAIFLAGREEKRLGLPKDTVIDLALWLIPLGILGARLYYVVFAWDTFRADPISVLYIWNGGLAIYGGILGGGLAAVLFAWRRRLSMLTLFDMIVPGLALAQAIGRWGNFFNMEAYGAPVTDPAWQFFPAAVLIPSAGRTVWHMATFFYESMWDLALFAVLWALRRHTARRGDLFLWYVLGYGSGRLVIEGLRMDSLYTVGGTGRVSQLLSVCACLAVICVLVLRAVRRSGRLWPGAVVFASAAVICLLLPAPVPPFPGANIVWALLCGTVLGGCVPALAKHKGRAMLLLIPPALSIVCLTLRTSLAVSGARGLGADTLNCALYALFALTSAACMALDDQRVVLNN